MYLSQKQDGQIKYKTTKEAKPSTENAMKYFINTQVWASKENIETFYFSSFDESWKTGDEGDVGAYWGLWDKNEKVKFWHKPNQRL